MRTAHDHGFCDWLVLLCALCFALYFCVRYALREVGPGTQAQQCVITVSLRWSGIYLCTNTHRLSPQSVVLVMGLHNFMTSFVVIARKSSRMVWHVASSMLQALRAHCCFVQMMAAFVWA